MMKFILNGAVVVVISVVWDNASGQCLINSKGYWPPKSICFSGKFFVYLQSFLGPLGLKRAAKYL